MSFRSAHQDTSPSSPSDDVVVGINYYAPHVSGLSITAQQVAESLVAAGCRVRVVCQRHNSDLPEHEIINGVIVERVGVIARIENGLISPSFPGRLRQRARSAKLLHLHLPMLEAGMISLLAAATPTIVTYQCDFVATNPVLRPLVQRLVDKSSKVAIRRAASTVVSSRDYASHSRIASALETAIPIYPAVLDRRGGTATFRVGTAPHFGFLGRIAPEKGLLELLEAFHLAAIPDSVLLIAGPIAESANKSFIQRVRDAAGKNPKVRILGSLPESDIPNFYASIDAFVLPSTNRLEAFGIAQAEALLCDIPVIATDLPGVRTLVRQFGHGVVIPPSDVRALSVALREVLGGTGTTRSNAALGDGVKEYVELIRRLLADVESPR